MKIDGYRKTLSESAEAGTRKAYRAAPGNFDAAARYAVTLARKFGEEIVVLPGNSYGSGIYHLARTSEDLRKYTVSFDAVLGATATPEGLVRMATVIR